MKKGIFFTIAVLFILLAYQASGQLTQYNIGGPGYELATKIKYLPSDGSTIIAGYSYDLVSGSVSNCQAILMKVTALGTLSWQKTFGIPGTNNIIEDMIITQDNNIIVVGTVGGVGDIYADNTAAILKYNAATGNLMWQNCFRDAATTVGGEFFFGVTELTDGTGRIVAVGTHNFTPAGAGSMVCVFQSTGALIYNEVDDIASGDEYRGVVTSASGGSVYMCGEFVGNLKDGRVISYTPGTSSGTINWSQNFDYYALGTLPNNFFANIYLSGSKLVVLANNANDYTGSLGETNAIVTLNAADGSGALVRTIQNSGAAYGNSCGVAIASADHVFTAQTPSGVSYNPAIVTTGVTTNSVITEITSLSASTANTPVKFTSPATGEYSVLDMALHGSTLFLAGCTNITTGFGNNDIYFVNTGSGLSSLNHTCDTMHDVVSITAPPYTNTPPAVSVYSFTPTYSTVDTGSTDYNIALICGDPATICASTDTTYAYNDTVACSISGSITITAPGGYSSWLWNTGATTSSISADSNMTYWVYADSVGCKMLIDTVHVAVKPTPRVNLGNDTAFCAGDSIIITNLLADGSSQLWSSGSTGPSITIHTSGVYWLDVSDAGCTGTDTIHVTVNPIPRVDIGPDTTVCEGTMLSLQSADSYASPTYLWSTGSTNPSITVSAANVYWLDVTVAGCTGADTMNLFVSPIPSLNLGDDTAICPQDSIILNPQEPAGTKYLWSTGSNSSAISVSNPGIYKLTVTLDGCSTSDSIQISNIIVPTIDLGPDTTLCAGDVYYLNAGNTMEPYTWSTGVTGQNINITQSGTYWAIYKGVCGIVSDTVTANFELCDISLPSAFTPNDDGLNDIIKVVGNLQLYKDFSLSIYNRWGQRVFHTTDIYDGWDGKFNGVKQDLGTYFYMLYYDLEGKTHMMKGDIELIR